MIVAAVSAVVLALSVGGAGAVWDPRAPLPEARSEVAAAPFGDGVAVVGGYLPDGSSSDVPDPRGGTGAAVTAGTLVSVGGEEPEGTIGSVFGYDLAGRKWRRLSDMITPRHGLGVVSLGGRIYAIGGGTKPGLAAATTNESLSIP